MVSELDDLRRENDALRRRAADAEQALAALASGEVDAVSVEGSTTPVLLQEAQEHLRRSENLLRAVFEGAQDAMLLADDGGRYVDANPAACELFGVRRGELLGRTIADFTAPGYDAQTAFSGFREGGAMRGRFPLLRPDGGRRTLDFSAVAHVAPGLHLSVLRDITEQLGAEEALRRNEALFRAVVEKSAEAIALTAADGTTRYLTPASATRMLGWSIEELTPRTARDLVFPEDLALLEEARRRLKKGGPRDLSLEYRMVHRDGSARWIACSLTNLLDDPDVRAIVGNYRDVTARKEAEEATRTSRDSLELAQAIAHVGSWSYEVAGAHVVWSAECYRIFGEPVGTTILPQAFFARIHPEDRERVRHAVLETGARGAPLDVEHRIERPDGTVRWVHAMGTTERRGGALTRILGTVHDMTDRHAAIDALKASEDRYRGIVEGTQEGVWTYDAEGTTTFMNGRLALMLGCTVESAVGRPIFDFMAPSAHEAARQRLSLRRKGVSERSEFLLRRTDGSELFASVHANPIFDAEGRFEGVLALVGDISSRRRADETRAELAALVESSADAIIGIDLQHRVTSWNMGASRLYQYTAVEMIGRSIEMLIPAASLAGERLLLERAAGGETIGHHETQRQRKDGSLVDVSVTCSPIRGPDGTVVRISKIARDLTERRQSEAAHRRMEEQFRQAQKMEAVGRLAGGVAHDFNNLLSVIMAYSNFALNGLKDGDPVRADIVQIQGAADRASALTRQLLAFSRRQILQPRVLDLNQVVAGLIGMLSRLLGEDVQMSIGVGPALGRVLADPGQVEQILVNLAVNARDAMPDGGKLTIETANVDLDTAYAATHANVKPGAYVMVAVSDTGFGMDTSTLGRIFEPFFTTKEKGKGTGLGLSTVLGIAEQSGGHVGVYSEPGHGSTFKVYLPRTDQAFERPAPARSSTALGGSETILLVEDENQVRAAAAAILRRGGYNVLDSSNGSDALRVSKGFESRIDLLLTDVVMPVMSGRKLADQMLLLRPGIKVLFASGYTDDAIVHHGVLDAGVAFIQKPFTPEALLRRVREVLEGAGAPMRSAG